MWKYPGPCLHRFYFISDTYNVVNPGRSFGIWFHIAKLRNDKTSRVGTEKNDEINTGLYTMHIPAHVLAADAPADNTGTHLAERVIYARSPLDPGTHHVDQRDNGLVTGLCHVAE
jgi:hypothetical protein